MAAGARLPQLERLCIAGSASVTDEGVRRLAQGCVALREVDLCFCHGTTYGSVYWLRKYAAGGHNVLVRRQPPWLDGVFECPWGEQHTYWPDGSFSFDRSREAKGWISRLRCRGGGSARRRWLEDRMIYVDVEQEQKGVQYMQPEDGTPLQHSGREVRVVQWFGSDEREEPLFPAPSLWDHIPLGRSVLAQTQDGGQVLLSRIRVRPLQGVCPDSPPKALQRLLWLRLAKLDKAVAEDLMPSRGPRLESEYGRSMAHAGEARDGPSQADGGLHLEAEPVRERESRRRPSAQDEEEDEDDELTVSHSSSESSAAAAEEVLSLLVSERWYEEVD